MAVDPILYDLKQIIADVLIKLQTQCYTYWLEFPEIIITF